MKNKIKNKKGITLIALVITIIVLLILAGVSISMISSQDGILNKTIETKKTMSKAELEEKIELAVMEWKLEKETNSDYNKTLEEFLDEKEEIKSSKIEDELTWMSGDTVVTIDSENNITVGDKSKNLVKNGYLENKNNENFTSFIYNEEGFLSITTNIYGDFPRYLTYAATEYIPVDTSKKYKESYTCKMKNVNSYNYLGILEYDIDYKRIDSYHFMYVKNTLTYLTQDLKEGDTEIHLNNISNFEYNEDTPDYKNGIIVWNYKDSTGYQYKPLTYSRNVYRDIYDYNEESSSVDKENNVIKLKEAWSGETVEKGTYISQSNQGASYHYTVNTNLKSHENWKTYTNFIQGEKTNGHTDGVNKFRPGTKFVKPVYMAVIKEASQNTTAYIKNIVFEEVE